MAMQDADKGLETQPEERPETARRAASPVPAVASGLVGLILEHDLRKGRRVEIPSLGISIGGDAFREEDETREPAGYR